MRVLNDDDVLRINIERNTTLKMIVYTYSSIYTMTT